MNSRSEICVVWPTAMRIVAVGLFSWLLLSRSAPAQDSFDREPINYSKAEVHDPIARLQQKIDNGQVELKFDEQQGYLNAVLKALDVPLSSQMLVFSKTSFQQRRITPHSPRALYFNDEVYVGWVPSGEVVEISSVDPRQGAIFYTLGQKETARPQFIRDQGNCLTCHATSRTHGVPGHLVRSVYSSRTGLPHFGSGTFRTNHSSPFKQRWGGWYVTGTHGAQRHMGNVIARDRTRPSDLDVEDGANVTDLSDRVSTDRYLTDHSDIVALMVLEHQTEMHNLITAANYQTRLALHSNDVMNRALERPDEFISDSTHRRVASAADDLLEYLLFVDETPLTDAIRGTTCFAEKFTSLGPRDEKGRSLRQFDLKRRIFKHPCSYLIYSDAFRALPPRVKEKVYRRLWEVLTEEDRSETFEHLSSADRLAILEILRDTNTDLPEYWQRESR